jgi:Tfp pilus assembly protein PilX
VKRRACGSALVVVLVLMSALGALALAAVAAATTALALSGHQQMAQNAFEAAETGIVAALLAAAETRDEATVSAEILAEIPTARASYHTETREAPGPGSLPAGFTVGENAGSFTSRHFFITADGESGRGVRARLEQGFYVVVPAG